MKKRFLYAHYLGKVYRRQTDRTYTHLILVRGELESRIRETFAEALAYDQKQLPRYSAIVDRMKEQGIPAINSDGKPDDSSYGYTLDRWIRWRDDVRTRIETSDERLAKRLADAAAEKLRPETWAGRPDLADKAVRRLSGIYREVVQIPVVEELPAELREVAK